MPKVETNIDWITFWKFKLSRLGYGSYKEICTMDASTFMNLIHYENFLKEYEKAVIELNKKG